MLSLKKSKYIFDENNLEVIFTNEVRKKLNKYRQVKDVHFEEGGQLMGELYPAINKIIVTEVVMCKYIIQDKYGVVLDGKCLNKKMKKVWRKSKGNTTYLGDWHTHPQAIAKPSGQDKETFEDNYWDVSIEQNVVLYLILGNEKKDWLKSYNGKHFKSAILVDK